MRWVADTPRRVAQLAERHVWLFAIASVVFWTLLSPLALVWLVLWLFARYRARGTSPAAKQERRVARLLRWYPVDWRTRYGDEMAALLHDTIADGRDGPLMTVNVAREGMPTRLAPPARRQALAGACLGLCWLPLLPQGVVAVILKSVGTPTRSWLLAFHALDAYQWPLIAVMVALGRAMLGTGITLARTPAVALPD